MNFKCCLGQICLILLAFPYLSNCQIYPIGYAYQLISGSDEGSSLSPELILIYHNCWIDDSCKYIARLKTTGQYVMLKSRKQSEKMHDVIWKKRLEGMRYSNFFFSYSFGTWGYEME